MNQAGAENQHGQDFLVTPRSQAGAGHLGKSHIRVYLVGAANQAKAEPMPRQDIRGRVAGAEFRRGRVGAATLLSQANQVGAATLRSQVKVVGAGLVLSQVGPDGRLSQA